MRVLVVAFVLLCGCLPFRSRVAACVDAGNCQEGPDGGSSDGGGSLFTPLDGGFLCSGDWCWENPHPHGTRLNAVYGAGDEVVVAGDYGMLAEYRQGVWRSFQGLGGDVAWTELWGRSSTDVYLAGSSSLWHRHDAGWESLTPSSSIRLTSVTGAGGAVYVSSADGVVSRLDGTTLTRQFSTPDAASVEQLVPAFNSLFAIVTQPYPESLVIGADAGVVFVSDGGGIQRGFGSADRMWLLGESSHLVTDVTAPPTPLAVTLTAGSAASEIVVSTSSSVGTLSLAGTYKREDDVPDVRALHQQGASTWGVGEGGLVVVRRDGGWSDPSGTPTRAAIRAFVPMGDALLAVSADGDVLSRAQARWVRRLRVPVMQGVVVDAVADGPSLLVLTDDQRLFTVVDLQVSGPESFGSQMTGAHRLWRTPAGAVVVTSEEGVFVRAQGQQTFRLVGGTEGAWGVAGVGSVVRVCGLAQERIVDIDTAAAFPVAVTTGVTARECRALVRAENAWAYSGRRFDQEPFVVVVVDGQTERRSEFNQERTWVEAMAVTPGGIAVGVNGVGLVRLMLSGGVLLPTHMGNQVFAMTTWKGRLFVGGANGAIVQAPWPQ